MKASKQRTQRLFLSGLLLCLSTSVAAQSLISANRRIDWSRAGVVGGCRYTLHDVPGERIEWYRSAWGPPDAARATCQGFGGTFVQPDFSVNR